MNNKNSLKYLIINILLIYSINVYSQESLYGLWKGIDKGEVGFIRFNEKGFAIFSINNETLGGDNFTINGISSKLTYVTDYSTNPIKLDLIVTRLDSNIELGRALGIIEFIDDHKIRLRINFDSPIRPIDFMPLDNEDTLVLEKTE